METRSITGNFPPSLLKKAEQTAKAMPEDVDEAPLFAGEAELWVTRRRELLELVLVTIESEKGTFFVGGKGDEGFEYSD